MSKRFVTILWSIAGLLAALTLLVKSDKNKGNDDPTALSQGDYLLADLPLINLAAVKISDAQSSLTLKKEDTQWSVVERAGYQANFAKLTRLLRSLTEATVAQTKKAGPAFNERFGMDPAAENQDNHGYQVTFLDGNGEELQSLSIGKATSRQGSQPSGKYLRLGNDPQAVYAINDSLADLSADPTDWLNSTFFGINGIKSIALNPAPKDKIKGWTISRMNVGSDFTIKNLAAGRIPNADKLVLLKNVLSGPGFEDVLSEEEAKEQRLADQARTLTITTFEGITYTLDYAPTKPVKPADTIPAGESEPRPGYVLKVTIVANLTPAREKKENETAEEAQKAEAAFASNQKALKEKIAEEQTYAAYYYLIADYTLSALNVGLNDLLEEPQRPTIINPPKPQPSFGPLAPPAVEPPATPAPAPTSARVESHNADALEALSDEDIQRIIRQSKGAQEEERREP